MQELYGLETALDVVLSRLVLLYMIVKISMASHRIATVSRSSLTRSSLSHSCNYRPATEAILLAPNRLYHATGARFQNGGNRQQLRRTEKPSGMAARRGLHSTRAAGALPNDSQGRVQSDMSFPDNIPESQETAANTAFEKLFALKNQTILITGGGRGLGIALARGVIQAGGHAACMDILPSPAESEWSDLQALAKKSGLTVSYHSCDISKEADMRAAIGEISERGRSLKAPLKGAIACAGIQQKIPILEYPVEDFERMFRVNTTGAFITAKVVANDMVQNNEHGSIVMIASMSGTIANRVRFSKVGV